MIKSNKAKRVIRMLYTSNVVKLASQVAGDAIYYRFSNGSSITGIVFRANMECYTVKEAKDEFRRLRNQHLLFRQVKRWRNRSRKRHTASSTGATKHFVANANRLSNGMFGNIYWLFPPSNVLDGPVPPIDFYYKENKDE